MSVVVGYQSTPEGAAALSTARDTARSLGTRLVVVVSERADRVDAERARARDEDLAQTASIMVSSFHRGLGHRTLWPHTHESPEPGHRVTAIRCGRPGPRPVLRSNTARRLGTSAPAASSAKRAAPERPLPSLTPDASILASARHTDA